MEKIREIVTDYHAGKFWEETVYEAKDVRGLYACGQCIS